MSNKNVVGTLICRKIRSEEQRDLLLSLDEFDSLVLQLSIVDPIKHVIKGALPR